MSVVKQYAMGVFELVSVSSVKSLAAVTIRPVTGPFAGKVARRVVITPEDGDIRILMNGVTPTNSPILGTKLAEGNSRVISGAYNIDNLRMISTGSAVSVAVEAYFAVNESEEDWPGIRT